MQRYVLLYRDEDGAWIAEVPSLQGCISQGDSREEAIRNIQEAIECYLEEDESETFEDFIEPELIQVTINQAETHG
jgi:predicted RNase H-like HicB family nuclease